MADRFFTSDELGLGEYVLEGAEAHHLSAVRRFSPGDSVVLFNGNGADYLAQVISIAKKQVVLQITGVQPVERELTFSLTIASALPKGDRADFLLEKLTELGVSRFVPLITERSIVVPKPGTIEKYRRTVIEASKQCGRARLMEVETASEFDELLTHPGLAQERVILHTQSSPAKLERTSASVIVAIGPEGGFSPDELEAAQNAGWRNTNLGPRVLRVETAAIAAAVLLATGQ
jgi:16S rRNA (uracil1498-N3)-methyltransferase